METQGDSQQAKENSLSVICLGQQNLALSHIPTYSQAVQTQGEFYLSKNSQSPRPGFLRGRKTARHKNTICYSHSGVHAGKYYTTDYKHSFKHCSLSQIRWERFYHESLLVLGASQHPGDYSHPGVKRSANSECRTPALKRLKRRAGRGAGWRPWVGTLTHGANCTMRQR